jgi:predicted transcriptional regulator
MNHRMNQIYNFILHNPNCSEGEIASGVGLKRTPYTRQILMQLVAEGNIVRAWDELRTPAAFVYYVQQTEEMQL